MVDASRPSDPNPPKRRWLRRALIASQIVLGLTLGLAAAEYGFTKRADGAFPHVNFYVEDALLGVRLEPGASMRFRLHDNPVSVINVNAQGYRGADWTATPGEAEILVVGDSQVFGLGVEDDETFSARLAQLTGRPVLNAGVPTYGPLEYLAITQEILEQRQPKTVVYVLNFLNDPFELERPNLERHAVWDGWAVRLETAPDQVREFPGRRWLFSKSHLVYAARRWLHERDQAQQPQTAELGLPSEGSWEDLVAEGSRSIEHDEAVQVAAGESRLQRRKRLEKVEQELHSSHDAIDEMILSEFDEVDPFEAQIARSRPGDIVTDRYSEASRSITLTAAHIQKAASKRKAYIEQLRKKQRTGTSKFNELLTTTASLSEEIERLRLEIVAGDEQPPYPSVFDDHLALLADACARHGAELVVVALPVDVQVSAQEWVKYGIEPSAAPDMEASLALLGDLLTSVDALEIGARGLDATEALREAGPGAFLNGDIHMTAKGHAALAEALALTLASVPPPRRPRPGLPEGRSFPPAGSRWTAMDEVAVKGSTKAGCSTQIVGTWLKVVCPKSRGRRALVPSGIEILVGETLETLALVTADGLALVTPLNREPFTARFDWDKGAYELQITWPPNADGEPKFQGEIVKLESGGRPPEISAEAEQLCACHHALTQQVDCAVASNDIDERDSGCEPSCSALWGQVSAHCFASYAGEGLDCELLLACSQGDPLAAPRCPEGFVNATATNACYQLCDDRHPCDAGVCTAYNGAQLCLP